MTSKTTDEFTRSDVLRILGIDSSQLRRWERQGLYASLQRFEFTNLRELRNLQRLYSRVSRHQRGKRTQLLLREVRRSMGVGRPLLDVNYVWDAPGVVIQESDGRLVQPDTQQLVFNYGPLPPVRAKTLEMEARPTADVHVAEAERWFQKGLAIEEAGGPEEDAAAAYQQAVELNPRAAGAWVNLGTLHFRDGDLGTAEIHYRTALEIAPQYALAHFNLGNICEETGRLEESSEHYERSIEIHPTYADAHYNLALVWERLKEPMRAVRHWRSYLKLDPSSPWAGIARQQLDTIVQVTTGGARGQRR